MRMRPSWRRVAVSPESALCRNPVATNGPDGFAVARGVGDGWGVGLLCAVAVAATVAATVGVAEGNADGSSDGESVHRLGLLLARADGQMLGGGE
jgi:hypothetical protein